MPSAHTSKCHDYPRGYTGQRLPLLRGSSGSMAQTLRLAEAGILGCHRIRCQDSLRSDLDPGMYSVCLNTCRDGELTTSNSNDNSWHLLCAHLFSR